jgi:predicted DNA-binding WGR domain protein
MSQRVFEFNDGTSHKFWHIQLVGYRHTRTFGRVGSKGRQTTKQFANKKEAQESLDDLVYEKRAKGYVEFDETGEPLPSKPLRPKKPKAIDAEEARWMVLDNKFTDGVSYEGNFDFRGAFYKRRRTRAGRTRKKSKPVDLPNFLTAHRVDMSDCDWVKEIPFGWSVAELILSGCKNFKTIGEEFVCYHLDASNTAIVSLPDDISVDYRINLAGCTKLTSLPENLKVTSLDLTDCTSLTELPAGLEVSFLNISGCTSLETFPKHGSIQVGNLIATGCTNLQKLPPWLGALSQLNIEDCPNIKKLPKSLTISSWLDFVGSSLTSLPRTMRNFPLRWRGVPIDYRTAFQPHRLKGRQIIAEENVERRRVMLAQMGFEKFLTEVDAEVLDSDTDTGGERKLVIRVPPRTRTCRQGIAWTAGFDDPDEYDVVKET